MLPYLPNTATKRNHLDMASVQATVRLAGCGGLLKVFSRYTLEREIGLIIGFDLLIVKDSHGVIGSIVHCWSQCPLLRTDYFVVRIIILHNSA